MKLFVMLDALSRKICTPLYSLPMQLKSWLLRISEDRRRKNKLKLFRDKALARFCFLSFFWLTALLLFECSFWILFLIKSFLFIPSPLRNSFISPSSHGHHQRRRDSCMGQHVTLWTPILWQYYIKARRDSDGRTISKATLQGAESRRSGCKWFSHSSRVGGCVN